MSKSAFDKISLASAFESFIVFAISGFSIVTIGSFFVDLAAKDLPKWFLELIQEPISIAFFFILSIISLIITALVTCGGKYDHNGKWWFEKIVLAISRAGISCGFIASGMLIGVGTGLFLVIHNSPDPNLIKTSKIFMALGIYCLALVYPVALLMLYLINHNDSSKKIIDLFGFIYISFVLYAGFKLNIHKDTFSVLAIFSIFIIYVLISKKWLHKTLK